MRVLQTMAGAQHGGAEAFFERLAIGLKRAGITQKIIIRKDDNRAERLRAGGLDPVELPFGGMLDFQTPRKIKRLIAEFNPDIVLSWMNRATKMTPAGKGYKLVARQGGFYDLKYYRQCDYIVGNTHGIVEYLIAEGWPEDRAKYLPNFVTIEQGTPISRAAFSTPEDAPLLLSLGRLHTNKAFDTLLDAVAKLEGVYVWIAGEGPERPALENQARNLGIMDRVRFLGWQQDVSSLLAACDIYVCPSRHEPLGNVVIEGWASHRPVVAAKAQGPLELIRHGSNGMLANIDDADNLADILNEVIGDKSLAQKIATAGLQSYEESFTEAVVVEQYLTFFKQIMGER